MHRKDVYCGIGIICLAVLLIVALTKLSGATWKPEYALLPPEVRAWYAQAELTPKAEKRLGWKMCCDHADVVKTQFRMNEKKDEWWYLLPDGTWKQVPPDIIHWGIAAPYGQATLFIYSGTETCFFPPNGGT